MKIKIFLFFSSVSFVLSKCNLTFKYMRVCKFYKLNGGCFPSNYLIMEKNCAVIKITRNEKRCPTYNCDVYFSNFTHVVLIDKLTVDSANDLFKTSS